jgi:hypothetical protein
MENLFKMLLFMGAPAKYIIMNTFYIMHIDKDHTMLEYGLLI